MRFTQVIYAQLPDWARPDNIMQHYARGREIRPLARTVLTLLITVIIFALVMISLLAGDNGYSLRADTWGIYAALYLPILVIQLVLLILAPLQMSAETTNSPQWETLKITSHGAELVIRARWAAEFYRLRGSLLLVMVPRLLFALLMLADVTRNGGYHLDLYLFGITPNVPLEIAIINLAALITAALLQFPVLLALNAAFGLLISTLSNRRAVLFTVRVAVLIAEIALIVLALGVGWKTLTYDPLPPSPVEISTVRQWIGLILLGTAGDQSLRFMDLETTLHTWADVDYGVWLGAILLLVVVVEMIAIKGLLALAIRRASRPAKE